MIITLIIIMVIYILTSSIVFISYFLKKQKNTYLNSLQLRNNLISAENIFINLNTELNYQDSLVFDLFSINEDSIKIKTRPWGVFKIASITATKNKQSKQIHLLFGCKKDNDDSTAIYLASKRNLPLSLSGNTFIKGDCFVPLKTIKKANIQGKNYQRKKLLDGEIYQSDYNLPILNENILTEIEKIYAFSTSDRNNISNLSDNISNSYDKSPIIIKSESSIKITSDNIVGNIIIISKKEICIEKNAYLNNAIVIAPKIIIKSNRNLNLQAFAMDSILIDSNVFLHFPSCIGIIGSNEKKERLIFVDKGCTIKGELFLIERTNSNFNSKIKIMKSSQIEGLVYSTGSINLQGTLYGEMYTNNIIYSGSGQRYDNLLLDATVDKSKLSNYFSYSFLIHHKNSIAISKCLE